MNNPISQTRRIILSVWCPFPRLASPTCTGCCTVSPAALYAAFMRPGCMVIRERLPDSRLCTGLAACGLHIGVHRGIPIRADARSVYCWHRPTCTGCCTGSVSVPWLARRACSALLSMHVARPLPHQSGLCGMKCPTLGHLQAASDRTWTAACRMYCPGNRLAS